jgi:hypothetical protein
MRRITAKFRAYLKLIGFRVDDPMHPLAGVNELRAVVKWANATPEDEHDFMTPAELIARYRKEQRQ